MLIKKIKRILGTEYVPRIQKPRISAPFGKYLDYYETLKHPGYAVLINGHWGSGKTFQIKNYYGEEGCYYVSLFGVKSPEDAHSLVYAAYAPTFEAIKSRLGKMSSDVSSAGGLFSVAGAATGWLSASIRRQLVPDKTLIFDDLERVNMPLEEMMGVFSTYIDSVGFRVVLIADEEKLVDKFKDFPKVKEKQIGHTSTVHPEIDAALPSFLESLPSSEKNFIQEHKDLIVSIFNSSGCKSLRVLRHAVLDLSRLFRCLKPEQLCHGSAMTDLVSLFVACGIEVRTGNLAASDLRNRAGSKYSYYLKQEASKPNLAPKPKIVELAEKHPTVNIESQILTDDVLDEIFSDGNFDSERISASVSESSYFQTAEDLPYWKQVALFDESNDASVNNALNNLQRQFDNREVTSSGEMLHIFALRLMMAAQGISGSTVEEARDECVRYIEDLVTAERLPPRELDWRWHDKFDHAYGGYVYWVQDTYASHFNDVLSRLILERELALERTYPEFVAELIELMKVDGKAFYRRVCQTANNDSPLAFIPVFKSADPVHFVNEWLSAPRTEWRSICKAIEDRLEVHRVAHELKAEKDWGLSVLAAIEQRRDALNGFERLRLSRIIPAKLNALKSM